MILRYQTTVLEVTEPVVEGNEIVEANNESISSYFQGQ
jgi:hypothetical protein